MIMARTLKYGSIGSDVRTLQAELNKYGANLDVDGIFGKKTEDAVKSYQSSKGLVIDGIVGERTRNALFPPFADSDDITITKGYINTHITHSINRPIKYIAVHYTAGSTSKKGSAMATRNVFLKRNASADFVVDDETILQINPDIKNNYTWHCGDTKNQYTKGGRLYGIATNKNTIGIEICSNLKAGTSANTPNHEGWFYTDASIKNAIKLIRYLMAKYNIPKSNVVRHYDISGKMCPGVIGYNDAWVYSIDGKQMNWKNNSKAWDVFKGKI